MLGSMLILFVLSLAKFSAKVPTHQDFLLSLGFVIAKKGLQTFELSKFSNKGFGHPRVCE
jgi:hypothetical protein